MKFEVDKSAHINKTEITYKPLTFSELKVGDKFVFANSSGEPVKEREIENLLNSDNIYMVITVSKHRGHWGLLLSEFHCQPDYCFSYFYLKVVEKKD